MRHLWYLTEDTVIFGLFGPGLSEVEKQEIAEALVQVPRPRIPLQLGKPAMPYGLMTGVANPLLASFVGPQSWKLWELLGVGSAWLQLPVPEWAMNKDYQVAKTFVLSLKMVKDERCIQSITDYATATRDSAYRGTSFS